MCQLLTDSQGYLPSAGWQLEVLIFQFNITLEVYSALLSLLKAKHFLIWTLQHPSEKGKQDKHREAHDWPKVT